MGLLPQLLLGALIVAAFAATLQQRLAIASHNGPLPARQIAYQMRVYHQSSVTYKEANAALSGTIAAPPPSLTPAAPIAAFFVSCADAHSVVTTLNQPLSAYTNQEIAQEMSRQSVSPPELGGSGKPPQAIGIPGIGLSNGMALQTGLGLTALPAGCAVAAGLPAIVTQAVP
jgi:hypothetical protein